MSAYRAYEQEMDGGFKQVCLESRDCQLAILPSAGFNLYSAVYKDRQLLMPTVNIENPMATAGVPILFPMPNRTRNCKYSFGGHDCEIRKNGELRFLHGLFMDEPFEFCYGADEKSAWAKGIASVTKDSSFFASYPFPCTLTILYTLDGDGLRLTYTVTNDGDETLPYGFAIHPYFNKLGQADKIRIQVPAPCYYEAEMCMPSGKLLPVEGMADMHEFRPVEELYLDHVFSGMSGKTAKIAYDELGFTLALNASEEFCNMVVYTPHNRPGFCLENQTNATDFLNLYAQGIETAHMNTVEPGASASGWIQVSVC